MMILPRSGFGRGADSVVLVLFWVLGSVLAKDTAFVEVVLFESSPNGDYTTYTTGLQGRFSRAGATISAEGDIVQTETMGVQNGPPRDSGYPKTRAPPCPQQQ
ncbi:E3 ubiquitin- ligase ZNRF3 [Labeo rohita]|uniref:E3 ubiquitin-ligase ZNRF3 n=1 Tax=Labeo rohita TaxID=84645 RepID=A0A498NGE0_LABRO|nr:E3 ubiquitin- ligase ZNRF3 [Labeo rohita]RXN37459.1 E3 ubiquitin- ligase ZNRF3 [Labeo rohita]